MASSVPMHDSIVRHCGHQKIEWDGGLPVGVYPAAFELYAKDNGYLSTSWLEYFGNNSLVSLKETVVAMENSGRKLGKNSALVTLSVSQMLTNAKAGYAIKLRVLHEPKLGGGNKAYSTVRGYQPGAPQAFLVDVFLISQTHIVCVGHL
jgi:hypothetical protein